MVDQTAVPGFEPATVSQAYDKKGYKNLIRDFRRLYFDDRNLTKKRCEVFFGKR
jgi:hypothetical protein